MITIEEIFAMDERRWDDFLMRASKDEMKPALLALKRIIKDSGEAHVSPKFLRRYTEMESVFNIL
jgi:hypothetical protein